MQFIKFFWFLRGLFFKFFFGKFGNLSYIGPPIFIYNSKKIYVGNKVRIYPNARIEAHGEGSIIIEDDVSIGQNLHITAYDNLTICSGTAIASNVVIMSLIHDVKIKDAPYMSQPLKGKITIIGKNCLVGSNSIIMAGVILGDQCVVGANSVVTKSFPSYSVIVGNPARILKKLF